MKVRCLSYAIRDIAIPRERNAARSRIGLSLQLQQPSVHEPRDADAGLRLAGAQPRTGSVDLAGKLESMPENVVQAVLELFPRGE